MVLFELAGSASFALALLVGLVFVKYSDLGKSKGFGYIGAGAFFFLLHAAMSFGVWELASLGSIGYGLTLLWGVLGWLLLLVGVVFITLDWVKS